MDILGIIKQATKRDVIDYHSLKFHEWLSWYAGKVKRFHRYTINNGKKRVPMERLTLGMPKKICEDWANLLMNEKTNIVLSNESAQKVFDAHIQATNFWKKSNGAVEKYMALGIGAFVEGVKGLQYNDNGDVITNGTPFVQVINGTKVYPITFENDKVTECAFVNENPGTTMISIHILNEQGFYDIHNITCKNDIRTRATRSANLQYNPEDHTIFHTKSATPWFQIIKPNIENNIDINSPMGISVFANAIDILRSVDMTYDSMYNELNLGRKRIFISTRAIKIDPVSGEPMQVFDQNDVEYYTLPESEDGKILISDNTQALRVDAIDQALQRQLNLLSAKCGFGQNHYKFEQGGISTATQVVSENSDLFRTLKKHEIILEEALIGMAQAMIEIINTYTSDTIAQDPDDIKVEFDDSIIEDKESEKTSDRQDLQNGVISRAEYRAKWYAEDLDTAEKRITEIAIQNNQNIISDIVSIRDDISHKTALELNPYIDDVEAELREIEKERESSMTLFTDEELTAQLTGVNDANQDTNAAEGKEANDGNAQTNGQNAG
ncbi:MAG: phage portal protein [Clostridia bacterium]|nr:phage portal protein [Clostridia bacterium]